MNRLHIHAQKTRHNTHAISDNIIYRWSPRSMNGEALSQQELMPLFEAARWAPSSSNNQEWRYYYALRQSDAFNNLFKLLNPGNREWAIHAGALVVLASKKHSDYKDYAISSHAFDTGASWQNFAIEAIQRGYVVHAMGGFDKDHAYEYLLLSKKTHEIHCVIAVGKPSETIEQETVSDRSPIESFTKQLP